MGPLQISLRPPFMPHRRRHAHNDNGTFSRRSLLSRAAARMASIVSLGERDPTPFVGVRYRAEIGMRPNNDLAYNLAYTDRWEC